MNTTMIQDAVVGAVRDQKWFQRNANTIVAGLGFLAGLLGFIATLPLPIQDEYRAVIPLVAGFLTTLATKFTINGVQPQMIDKLEAQVASAPQIDLAPIQSEIARSTREPVEQIDIAGVEARRWIDTNVDEAIGQAQGAADYSHQLDAEPSGRHSRIE